MSAKNIGRGTGNLYAKDGGGNHIARLREAPVSSIKFSKSCLRFCETCKTRKERNDSNAVKGWKCLDCKQKECAQ